MSLLDELKRRKVFKVGAAYLVVAWLAVQAASIGFPAFDAPPWALRVFILIALLGFPIAVVMAWVFDFTREGVKLDVDASGSKRLFAVAALLIVLALGWYFYGQPSFRKGDPATPVGGGPNSIAVLPFANIGGKADEDYFSDGMTEELLNVLAKIPKLNVVARTSVFEFKGKGGDVREIGRKLGVSHIVEGSVRREGEAGARHSAVSSRRGWLPPLDRKLQPRTEKTSSRSRTRSRNKSRGSSGQARRLRQRRRAPPSIPKPTTSISRAAPCCAPAPTFLPQSRTSKRPSRRRPSLPRPGLRFRLPMR